MGITVGTRHAVSLQVNVALCYLYSIHFLPLRQGEYHEVGRGYVKKL